MEMAQSLLQSLPAAREFKLLFSSAPTRCLPSLSRMRVEAIPTSELNPLSELQPEYLAENPSALSATCSSSPSLPNLISERGISFSTGASFFRAQSSLGRDLAVLAAALHKGSHGELRVLDAMCGCGVRGLRYLTQSKADFVLANDSNSNLHSTIVENLSRYMPLQGLHSPPPKPLIKASTIGNPEKQTGMESPCKVENDGNGLGYGRMNSFGVTEMTNFAMDPHNHAQHDIEMNVSPTGVRWQVCHDDAAKLLLKCYLNMDYYDFIDVDSFGSESYFLGPALSALRFGGLLFVTCTDGFSSGGHRPFNSLAQYGTYMRPMPYANELGLRMLMGAVVKEAALRDMSVSPIFSIYAPHGPVFRVLVRASAGKPQKIMNYGFIYYCGNCGDSRTVNWENLGSTCCPCSEKVSDSLKMSGPLWTGPLHNTKDIQDMIGLAREWGWIPNLSEYESASNLSGNRRKKTKEKLWELLNLMLEESNPELPFGYIHLDEIARRGKVQSPKKEKFIQALRNEGYVASRSHVCPNAVKTNCPMTSCIELARHLNAGTAAGC